MKASGHRKARPRWAKFLLYLAVFPMVLLGSLVGIAAWPELDFDFQISGPGRGGKCGWGLSRMSVPLYAGAIPRTESLALSLGGTEVYWSRSPYRVSKFVKRGFHRGLRGRLMRALRRGSIRIPIEKGFWWQGDRQVMGFFQPL